MLGIFSVPGIFKQSIKLGDRQTQLSTPGKSCVIGMPNKVGKPNDIDAS